jgi:hypothetical protein
VRVQSGTATVSMKHGPPDEVCYDLEEADELLRDLELARDALDDLGAIGPLAGVETQVIRLHRKLGFEEGGLL